MQRTSFSPTSQRPRTANPCIQVASVDPPAAVQGAAGYGSGSLEEATADDINPALPLLRNIP